MWKLLVPLSIIAAFILLLARRGGVVDRSRFLQRAGLVLMAVFTLVDGVWIAAEAFTDPGGWQAVGLVAMWLVPLAFLLAVAWYRPAWATVLLTALTAALLGASIWFAADPEGWRAFENDNGPVRVIASFVLAAPIALLGWRKPLAAGVLLVVLGVVPVALSAAGTFSGLGSLTAVSIPLVLVGTLFLFAEAIARGVSAHPGVPTSAAKR